jgi:hypothetical protein
MATIPTTLSEPILVANLSLPPAVAEDVARTSLQYRYTRRERAAVEEDCKLRHHYAGHHVIAALGPRGLEIHAIDLDNPDEIRELESRLTAKGYRHVYSLFPTPLAEPDDQTITFLL